MRLALLNLRRLPARALVGLLGLATGVAAVALLVGVEAAFRGSLVGTLLGNAISLQVRALDFVAAGLVVALGAVSLADVLALSLRDRAPELATLRSVGWSDGDLARLVVCEALFLGLLGSAVGASLSLGLGLAIGLPAMTLAVTTALAAAGGIVVAAASSLLPVSRLGRLSLPSLLAEE